MKENKETNFEYSKCKQYHMIHGHWTEQLEGHTTWKLDKRVGAKFTSNWMIKIEEPNDRLYGLVYKYKYLNITTGIGNNLSIDFAVDLIENPKSISITEQDMKEFSLILIDLSHNGWKALSTNEIVNNGVATKGKKRAQGFIK
jgi:hypothetical protein